jgi:hypothetical protein
VTQTPHPQTADDLVGGTWHLLRGSKYAGAFAIERVEPAGSAGWFRIYGARTMWTTRVEDAFTTEAEARAEAKNRRKPRTKRQPQRLYGDLAYVALLNGINPDGTGRKL